MGDARRKRLAFPAQSGKQVWRSTSREAGAMKREQQGTTARPLAALVMAVALLAGCAADHPDPPPASQIRADAANVVDAREIVALAPGRAAADRLDRGARGQGFGFRE